MKSKKVKEPKNKAVEKESKENKNVASKESFKDAFSAEMFSEVIVKNPVLVSTIGLCPVVAICISMKSALILTLITYLSMIFAQVLSALIFKRMEQWVRIAFYTLSGMCVVAPMMLFMQRFFPNNFVAMGLYLPLLVINPLITRQCERVAIKGTVKEAFINAISCATGYAAVLLIIGFVREVFGKGEFFEFTVFKNPPIPSLTSPFAGFLLLGFLSAILHAYFKKIDPQYAEELSIHSRSSIKDPAKKNIKPKQKSLITEYESNNLVAKKNDVIEKTNLKDKKYSKRKKEKQEQKQEKKLKSKQNLAKKAMPLQNDKSEVKQVQEEKINEQPLAEKVEDKSKVADIKEAKPEGNKQNVAREKAQEIKAKPEKPKPEQEIKPKNKKPMSDNDIINSILEEYSINYNTGDIEKISKQNKPQNNHSYSSQELDNLLSMNLQDIMDISKGDKKDEKPEGEVPKE